MMLEDNPGILSKILARLVSEIGASIVTIHQDIPINLRLWWSDPRRLSHERNYRRTDKIAV